MNENSPLINLSLLECLKGKKQADELDLFIPFLATILEELDSETIDKNELQVAFNSRFEINTPLVAINTLLTRAKNLGLLKKDNKQYFVQFEEIQKRTRESKAKKQEIISSVGLVVEAFIAFSKEEFQQDIDSDYAENSIYNFIRKHISIFVDGLDGSMPNPKVKVKNADYLIASFIKYAHSQKKSLIPEITRIVKGTLLANYLTFADKTSQKEKFSNITVYIDTPIILGLLGWDGPTRKKSLEEFLELIFDLNAKAKVFDITVKEIRGVLSSWKEALRNKNYTRLHEMTRQLFKSRGTTPEQLNTEIVLLESTLKSMGIEVDDNFELDPHHCCDEVKLEKFLLKVGFKRPGHDIKCITRIFNSRAGKSINSLNDEFSIFITPNSKLEAVCNRFFKKDVEPNSVQVITSEKWLATFLWLKHPEHFASLPFDLLLTDAYSALNSDDHFWDSFLKRFSKLKVKGNISEEDFNLVRWDSSLFNMVQHASVLTGDDFAEDDIYSLVEEIKRKNLEDKQQEVDLKDSELKNVKGEWNHTSQKITKVIAVVSQASAFLVAILYGWFLSYGTFIFGPSLSAIESLNIKTQLLQYSAYIGFLLVVLVALIAALKSAVSIFRFFSTWISELLIKQFFIK
jgi:hypothetical protein